MEGKVVAVGPGARDETGRLTPLDVKPCDSVLFGNGSGTEVKIGGEERVTINEADILDVIEAPRRSKKAT